MEGPRRKGFAEAVRPWRPPSRECAGPGDSSPDSGGETVPAKGVFDFPAFVGFLRVGRGLFTEWARIDSDPLALVDRELASADAVTSEGPGRQAANSRTPRWHRRLRVCAREPRTAL